MTKTIINKPIDVTAVTFSKQFEPIPRRIEFEGRSLTFIGSGIRYLIKKGDIATRIFDMSDGEAEYRLRHDDSAWTLVAISQ